MAVLSPGPGRAGNAAPGFNLHPAPPQRLLPASVEGLMAG